jgi:hypothetical protein
MHASLSSSASLLIPPLHPDSTRHKNDHSAPITIFDSNAGWLDLAGHLSETHPRGARALSLMTAAQVEEHRLKFARIEGTGPSGLFRR